MTERVQNVALRIVGVWRDTDLRGRPVIRYAIEDEFGDPVGVFLTPVTSRLSEVLLNQLRRNRRK